MVDVDEHCLHLVHSHHGVHVIERRGVPEERMGSAEPLTGRSSPIEGPIGEDDDLGQQQRRSDSSEVSVPVSRRRRRVRGEMPRIRARRASETSRCDWMRSRVAESSPVRTATTGSEPGSGSSERAEGASARGSYPSAGKGLDDDETRS